MKKNLLGGAVVVLILIGISAYSYFTGAKIGEKCSQASDCMGNFWGKYGSQCYAEDERKQEGICTITCSNSKECPAKWTCEKADFFVNDNKKGVLRVCIPQAPTAARQAAPTNPAPAPTPVPAPNAQ